jgi:hypothetical protein
VTGIGDKNILQARPAVLNRFKMAARIHDAFKNGRQNLWKGDSKFERVGRCSPLNRVDLLQCLGQCFYLVHLTGLASRSRSPPGPARAALGRVAFTCRGR